MSIYPPHLPDSVRNDHRRRSEIVLYDLFKANLPDECAIIYNAEWICNFRGIDSDIIIDPLTGERARSDIYPLGEIDFILVTTKGLLVIEVKGGQVTVENSIWLQKDLGGGSHTIESPLSQARRNMFALLKTLKNGRRFYNRFLPTGYAVILPYTPAWEQNGKGLPLQLIVFQEHVNGQLLARLEGVIKYWKQLWGTQVSLSAEDVKDIAAIFAPTVQVKQLQLRRTLDEFQTHLLELTESQFGILKVLSRNKKALITGGAGTGKTLLAMEKAKQTAQQGHRTLFTCANRLLTNHVRRQLSGIGNLEVMNFHELCYTWGKKAGIKGLKDPDGPGRYHLPQEYYDEVLPATLVDAAGHVTPKYDAVIVDEAQDMHEIFWTALQFCFENEEDAIFYIFFDPDQAIWYPQENLPFTGPCFQLTVNLRNSVHVFEKVRRLSPSLEYEQGCSHQGQFKTYLLRDGADSLESRLLPILEDLHTKNKIPLKDISILTGRSRNKSRLAEVEQIGPFPLTRELHDTGDRILFSSVRQYRGMEAPVIILIELDYIVDLEKLAQELQGRNRLLGEEHLKNTAKETLLIGISRAQHTLYVLADEKTVQQLNEFGLNCKKNN